MGLRERISRELPESLYQYRSLEGDNLLYLRRLLLSGELYLGSPSKFNDPFDGKVNLDFTDLSVQDYRRYFDRILRKYRPEMGYEQRRKMVTRMMASGHYKETSAHSAAVAEIQAAADKTGIACFSEVPDDILMWAHYAASHSGVCVKFDRAHADSILSSALPVVYSEKYEPVKALSDDDASKLGLTFLTKADCWAYEREWRILSSGRGIERVPPSTITGIILGCRMEHEMRNMVLEIVSERKEELEVLRATKSSNRFGIDLTTIVNR